MADFFEIIVWDDNGTPGLTGASSYYPEDLAKMGLKNAEELKAHLIARGHSVERVVYVDYIHDISRIV